MNFRKSASLFALSLASSFALSPAAQAGSCIFSTPNPRETLTAFLKQIDRLQIKNPEDVGPQATVAGLFDDMMKMTTANIGASCRPFQGRSHDECEGVCNVVIGGDLLNAPENSEIQSQAVTFQFVLNRVDAGGEDAKTVDTINGKVRVFIAE